jgi:hypothetical protein
MFHYTEKSFKIGGNTNSSFLSQVHKETNPSSFSKYRPISLCNSSYKILTKIISYCLKNLFPKIIYPNQGGFMKERQIIDNIVLVQEVIHSNFSSKSKGMVIKLDMANAFDHVCHSFLFQVHKKIGFSLYFIKWLQIFDGASRNNLEVAGVGGSLLDPGGNIVTHYSWGPGVASNNIVESCLFSRD